MKIIFLDESTINLNGDMDYSELQSMAEFITYKSSASEEETIENAKNAIHLIVNKVPITEKVINALPNLEHVAVIATGYNNIDLGAAAKNGVRVSNVPGYAKDCVPQHVFSLILNLATSIHRYNEDIRQGEWQKSQNFTLLKYPTFELAGKTIGIIGFGAIGKGVAKIADGFGMDILVYDIGDVADGFKQCSLDEILEKADVISLNCPLTVENKYMINAAALKKMKSTALLINTARGPLVNQQDLAEALNNGEIGGAGIDVLDEEPPVNNPLLGNVKNLILTPHSAWSTVEARQRLIDGVADNIKAAIGGERRNIVN
ncbi:MAG: D-2-hydroxyacid dehydrogenase [Melioribacteraceae bacterium]|nr:D-2-hydroxyacid dehydrogenase [Melioribacteraceae bacterium]